MFPIPSLDMEVNYDLSQDYHDSFLYSKPGSVEAAAASMNFRMFFDSYCDFVEMLVNYQDFC